MPAQHRPQKVAHTWFPRNEWPRALELWPELAEGFGATYEEYSKFLEAQLQQARAAGFSNLALSPEYVDEYVAWCEENNQDPVLARAHYAADLSRLDRVVPWPPPRNQPCWCGSGRKYKQCCGTVIANASTTDAPVVPLRPDLLNVELDRDAALDLGIDDEWVAHVADRDELATGPWGYVRVELLSGRGEDLEPPPGRVFLVAPFHDLCDLSDAIDRAFGRWDFAHLHEWELADGTRLGHLDMDPDGELGWEDEHDRLVLDVGDAGTEFTYTFDLGDGWTHRCVIEGTDEAPDFDDDELELMDPIPIFGWGDLPDQYGRTTPDE